VILQPYAHPAMNKAALCFALLYMPGLLILVVFANKYDDPDALDATAWVGTLATAFNVILIIGAGCLTLLQWLPVFLPKLWALLCCCLSPCPCIAAPTEISGNSIWRRSAEARAERQSQEQQQQQQELELQEAGSTRGEFLGATTTTTADA
jgi:hypothetical protein